MFNLYSFVKNIWIYLLLAQSDLYWKQFGQTPNEISGRVFLKSGHFSLWTENLKVKSTWNLLKQFQVTVFHLDFVRILSKNR